MIFFLARVPKTSTKKASIAIIYSIILHYIIKYFMNKLICKFNINLFMFVFLLLSVCARIDTYLWIYYHYLLWGKKLKCEKCCTRANSCMRVYFAIVFLFLFLFLSQNIKYYSMYWQFLNQFVTNIKFTLISSNIFSMVLYQLATKLLFNLVILLSISLFRISSIIYLIKVLFSRAKQSKTSRINTNNEQKRIKYQQLSYCNTLWCINNWNQIQKLQLELQLVFCSYLFFFYILFLFFSIAVSRCGLKFDLHSIDWEFSSKEEMYRESMVLRADIIWLLICLKQSCADSFAEYCVQGKKSSQYEKYRIWRVIFWNSIIDWSSQGNKTCASDKYIF